MYGFAMAYVHQALAAITREAALFLATAQRTSDLYYAAARPGTGRHDPAPRLRRRGRYAKDTRPRPQRIGAPRDHAIPRPSASARSTRRRQRHARLASQHEAATKPYRSNATASTSRRIRVLRSPQLHDGGRRQVDVERSLSYGDILRRTMLRYKDIYVRLAAPVPRRNPRHRQHRVDWTATRGRPATGKRVHATGLLDIGTTSDPRYTIRPQPRGNRLLRRDGDQLAPAESAASNVASFPFRVGFSDAMSEASPRRQLELVVRNYTCAIGRRHW